MASALMNTYKRLPVSFARGQGALVYDDDGAEYLDVLSGIAVCGLGHAHPAVASALCEQSKTLLHTSNLYRIPQQEQLGERLAALAGLRSVFFCNSGAEANEAALKLARLYGHQKQITNPQVIVLENSFHGRTLATLSATGNRRVQAGFEPLVQGFLRAPYNDLDAIRQIAATSHDVVAILAEPVQGEGGIIIASEDYLPGLRSLCDAHGWLLMLDEIQCGMGRTGEWFAFQHTNSRPDVLTLAKALGNGVPIGACLAGGKAADLFQPGAHGTTFGGNPLACAAATAVIDTIERDHLVARAGILGARMLDGFRQSLAGVDGVVSLRGMGLMLGIELNRPCNDLVQQALDQGVLINVTAERVVRLLPPLILSDNQADHAVNTISQLIRSFLKGT